jgi:hypothetical protein
MLHILTAVFILASATPAFAAPAGVDPYYHAGPSAKPAQAKLVLRDTIWRCGDAGCSAGRSNSRPVVVCEVLVREVGKLDTFTVAGEALAADDLEKCNARAR